jgi:hypothetical protein
VTISLPTTPNGPAAPSLDVQQQLMNRWNAAAALADVQTDFSWTQFDRFPHPTFKGGNAVVYGDFAVVLLTFFKQGDNFAYLTVNHLFETPLLYVFPSGQVGLNTTFKQITTYFASPTSEGDELESVRTALAAYLMQMN